VPENAYVSICQKGLEEVLSKEIANGGGDITGSQTSTVFFNADKKSLYRLNMSLRTALSILMPLKEFTANNYDELYFKTRKINWHKLFSPDKNIRIDVKGRSRSLNHSQFAMHRIKDAISDAFKKLANNVRPSVDKENPDIRIVAYLNENKTTIYLDSSGVPLFKRGYRLPGYDAPIKEDLASGIILLSGWDGSKNLLDPFCGSATFLIEAMMIANNIPPNLERNFSFFNWFDFDKEIYENEKALLKEKISPKQIKLQGYEIDKTAYMKTLTLLKKNPLFKDIRVFNEDFRKSREDFNDWFIITNPPYNERMKEEDINGLYKDFGDFLKQKCKDSTAYVLTANLEAAKHFGLRSSKRTILYNGAMEARLIEFKMY
jgi:putative N6-adenine-specific DNA methylase